MSVKSHTESLIFLSYILQNVLCLVLTSRCYNKMIKFTMSQSIHKKCQTASHNSKYNSSQISTLNTKLPMLNKQGKFWCAICMYTHSSEALELIYRKSKIQTADYQTQTENLKQILRLIPMKHTCVSLGHYYSDATIINQTLNNIFFLCYTYI